MKKSKSISILLMIAVLVLSLACFVGCNDKKGNELKSDVTIDIYVPDGGTMLMLTKMLSEDFAIEGYDINIKKVLGATDVATKISTKEADIAICPTNLAGKLYNQGIDIQLLSANVFGMMSLIGQPIDSLKDLEGESVYTIGSGATPEAVFKYVLTENGVDLSKVTFVPKVDGSEIIPLIANKTAKFALLGEPAASTVLTKFSYTSKIIDLQVEWEKLTTNEGYPQAGVVVNKTFLNENKTAVQKILYQISKANEWNMANLDKVNAELKEIQSSVSYPNTAVIELCNIDYVKGIDVKASMEKYFNTIGLKYVGGKLPDSNFYANIEPIE